MSQKLSNPPAAPGNLSDSSPEKSPSRSWRSSSVQRSSQPAPPSSQRRRSQAPSRTRRSREAAPTGDPSVWDVSTWERPSPALSTRGRSPSTVSARGRSHTRDRSPLASVSRTVIIHDDPRGPSPQPLMRPLATGSSMTVHVRGSSESTLTADSPAASQRPPVSAATANPPDLPPARRSRSQGSHRTPPERPVPPPPRVPLPVGPSPQAPSPPRELPVRVTLPPCTPPPPGPGDLVLPRTPGNYSSPEVEPVLDVTRLPQPRHLPHQPPATGNGTVGLQLHTPQ